MLRQMSGRQFMEWMVFAEMEPFSPDREDLRVGALIAALYNTKRKRGTPAYKPEDCAPRFGDWTKPKKDWRALLEIAKQWTAQSKAKVD